MEEDQVVSECMVAGRLSNNGKVCKECLFHAATQAIQ